MRGISVQVMIFICMCAVDTIGREKVIKYRQCRARGRYNGIGDLLRWDIVDARDRER